MIKSIAVFCSASSELDHKYYKSASLIGNLLAINNFHIVFGGTNTGMMGIIAQEYLKNKKDITGVMISAFKEFECINLKKIIRVDNLSERKKIMLDLSDIVLILPGGIGTMDELFEILALNQIRDYQLPVIILNIFNYWDYLIKMIEHGVLEGFINEYKISVIKEIDQLIETINEQ